MTNSIRRREFITLLGGAAAAAAWPRTARAQQPTIPVVSYVYGGTFTDSSRLVDTFRQGLSEMGYDEGRDVLVEYHYLDGQFDGLPALMADLIRQRVAVIATPGTPVAALAAKAATSTVPIVFALGENPIRLGLVKSFAQPGGNATGVNFFAREVTPTRLGLLHELLPKATRVAVLLNPANPFSTDVIWSDVQAAASALRLETHSFNASTIGEVDTAFAAFRRERVDALFVSSDPFLYARRLQITTLATRDRLPTNFGERENTESGGLMSYGANLADTWREVGIYTGSILKGAEPADLPVLQPSNFDFIINMQTARLLGIDVPPELLAIADEVIQ